MSFAKNMGKNISKIISKSLSGEYNFLITPKNTVKMYLKLFQKEEFKTAKATGDLIGNKIPDVVDKSYDSKITKVSRTSPQNSLEIPRERYISPEERQKIIVNLRLI